MRKQKSVSSGKRKKSDKANIKSLAFVLLLVLLFTSLVSVAFFEQGITGILRNNIIALVIFAGIYMAWLKVTSDYEKMFRSSLGR